MTEETEELLDLGNILKAFTQSPWDQTANFPGDRHADDISSLDVFCTVLSSCRG